MSNTSGIESVTFSTEQESVTLTADDFTNVERAIRRGQFPQRRETAMADPVKFKCTLKKQSVEVKRRKEGRGEDAYEVTDRIGKLALEFDADRVDIAALAKLIDGEEIWIGLDHSQMNMFNREREPVGAAG